MAQNANKIQVNPNDKKVNLKKIVGKGYGRFWKDKTHKYVVVKGGRGSKKSYTTALWIITHMMKYPKSNTLVVRQIYRDLEKSCFNLLQQICYKLGVEKYWKFKKSPLEAIYLPTGQKIMFAGLDDPQSVTSIAVSKGYLNYCWFEEAYQIKSEEAFDKIDGSLRGKFDEGDEGDYFYRIILTFNPWSEHSWLKRRFFDNPDDQTLALTTTYKCNEHLDEQFLKRMEIMKERNPRKYRVEGDGEWGISEGLIFEEDVDWTVSAFSTENITGTEIYGFDFGFNDPNALIKAIVNEQDKKIYVYDECVLDSLVPDDMEQLLKDKGVWDKTVIFDCARPELIAQFKKHGMKRAKECKKGAGSIVSGIQRLLDYKIIIDPSCVNLIAQLQTYAWAKDKFGKTLEKPEDGFDHCIDALRYALQCVDNKKGKVKFLTTGYNC